ncbi:riboflavin synthase [Robertmurraya sp. Marseille-Q9965]
MFTGIIEEIGTIQNIQSQGNTMSLKIHGKKVLEDIKLGDSIAVNGVCLTVKKFNTTSFFVDVMPETFQSTSLSTLNLGSLVNLERAMSANGRFGGHFVTGHVDTVGKIVKREPNENAIYLDLAFPKEFGHLALHKGSITLDGTSLTIFGVENERITVSLIPHTAKESVIGLKQIGDRVNMEFDMLGKYVYSFLHPKQENRITTDFLKENGFI